MHISKLSLAAFSINLLLAITACKQGGHDQNYLIPDEEPTSSASSSKRDYVPSDDTLTTFRQSEVAISMSDGVVLKAEQFVPEVSAPVTTVIHFYPYGHNQNLGGATTGYLPRHGYAELIVDVRGTGGSNGVWQLWSDEEKRDFAEVIQWATKQDYSDGQVVLSGQSYSAVSALHALEQDGVDSVKAAFIRVPMGDSYRDIATLGGAVNTGFFSWWSTAYVGGPSLFQPLLGDEVDPVTSGEHLANTLTVMGPTYASLLPGSYGADLPPELVDNRQGSYDSTWYHVRSPLREIKKIKAPVFIVGANYDIFQRAQPMVFDAIDLPNSQKKLLMVPDYHSYDPNWLSSDDGSRTVYDSQGNIMPSEDNLRLAWYNRWTKGTQNGIEDFPTHTQYYHGRESAVSYQNGAPQVQPRNFYLNPNATALPGPAGAGSLQSDAPSIGGNFSMLFQPASGTCSRMVAQYLAGVLPDDPACSQDNRINELDAWNLTTAPTDQPLRIHGPGNLRLWVHSTASDAQVVAFLTDVAPDGSSTEVSFGQLVASHRAIEQNPCPDFIVVDCSVYIAGERLQPWHPFTQEAQKPLTPGQMYELEIEINAAFVELQPGHSLRLSIKTGNAPAAIPAASVLADAAGGITTVVSNAQYPSRLVLGVIE